MRKRVDDHTINTLSFQEKVAFSADAPHSVRLKRFPFDEIVPLHYAETMEIVLVKDVVGSIIVGKKSHVFLPQDVVIIPPYYVHSTNCKKNDGFLYNVKVSFEELKAFMNIPAIVEWDRRVLFRRLFMPEAYDEMMRIVQRLIEQDDDIFARMHCLLDLFYLITRDNRKEGEEEAPLEPAQDDRLLRLIHWTNEHYSEHVTLDAVAEMLYMSKYYFCQFFKQATNMTYLNYLNNVRIQKAQQLLKTGCNVTECTERCGFESISYFISLFRKTLGCTPGQYMKKNGLISED